MQTYRFYRLSQGVQVRREKFGLLFYDYRGPRLYFVPSRELLEPDFFNGSRCVGDMLDSACARCSQPRQWIRDMLQDVLNKLEDKGLVYGQSVC
jgi:putative mycofactocin binding protein MftB